MAASGQRRSYPFLAMLAAIGCGCASRASAPPPPEAAFASERTAQQAFRSIRQRWAIGTRTERAALEPELRVFLVTYGRDGQAALARAYLALVLVERGRLEEAHATAATVLPGPAGIARDIADLAESAVLLASNKPELAYDRLLSLVGKMIDPSMRLTFDRLMVEAATQSGRHYEAIAYMDSWLRDAQEEGRSKVGAQVARALEAIPVSVLEQTLQAMERGRAAAGSAGAGYGTAIQRAVVARLGAVALARKDSGLASRIVHSSAVGAGSPEIAEGLQDLALSGARAVVDGHTIGLLVTAGTGVYADRSAEILSGAVDALQSQPHAKDADRARLVTRELREPDQTELALGALTSQGAAILVAALDPAQARDAANFAGKTGTPVILLSAPPEPVTVPTVFALGAPDGDLEPMLLQALEDRGARKVATVGGPSVRADASPPMGEGDGVGAAALSAPCPASEQPGGARLPVKAWKQGSVDGVLLAGDATCASDALTDLAAGGLSGLRAAVGLFGAHIAFSSPKGFALLVPTAGKFPLLPEDSQSPLDGYRLRHGAAPSWSVALGHDAVVLARAALRTLPLDRIDDPARVADLHRRAAETLASAQGELWSTGAKGFEGAHTMARRIQLRDLAAAGSPDRSAVRNP